MYRKTQNKIIAVFGGSFNPPTEAHKGIAKKVIDLKQADKVIVCPSYYHRSKGSQVDSYVNRLSMCNIMFQGEDNIQVSTADYESYVECMYRKPVMSDGVGSTLYLINRLKSLYGEGTRFKLVLGADCLINLPDWYEYKKLLEVLSGIIVMKRGSGLSMSSWVHSCPVTVFSLPEGLAILSSTQVREYFVRNSHKLKVGRNGNILFNENPPGEEKVLDFAFKSGLYQEKRNG